MADGRAPAKQRFQYRRASRWHVYIVRCVDDTLYCGVSNRLSMRVKAHSAGKGARYTKGRGPVVLVWSRVQPTRSHALRLEYQLKGLTRVQKESLVNGVFVLKLKRAAKR